MAVLDETNRAAIWADFMSNLSSAREEITINKADLRAAVDAVDSWVDDNAASYNSALPVAARNGLTAAQKALLLQYVVARRYQAGV